MAVLVGIDEAGYGPHLGPLVVATAAGEFPGDAVPDPDLWGALGGHVRKRPSGRSSRVVICDSKVAYSGRNVAILERAVLGFLAAMDSRPSSLAELLAMTAVGSDAGAAGSGGPRPWDSPLGLALPTATEAEEIRTAADHLASGLAGLGASAAGLRLNVASPPRFNRLVQTTRNKAAALFALTADLLAEVQTRWPHEAVHVTMDRHGGRRYYAGLLAAAFPMTGVETLEEARAVSRYCLHRDGSAAPVHLTIRNRCETWSLLTALASMAAKYVRELHMRQLNGYFQSLVPGLAPTAGYGRDAWRFLDDVAAAREAAGVPDAAILRCR
ncbi:MAG: hypothetical protein AMK72_11850 [Planctomycetes bacterium SM23_25]|nr:MAG: hypothetical protein AMK72_11850 [Planctomycetes bacterium SM23_25]